MEIKRLFWFKYSQSGDCLMVEGHRLSWVIYCIDKRLDSMWGFCHNIVNETVFVKQEIEKLNIILLPKM